jgi:inner membrane protein
LALSRAGLNRLTPQATAILVLAANAPDIDVVSAAGGSLAYLHYHRHLTHALSMAPVMAILPVLLVWAIARKPMAWGWAYFVSLVGVASHLALDLTNVYGVRLLLPFSDRWLRLDLNSIVDPWIMGALLLAVLAPALAKLVDTEIGAPSRPGRMAALLALAFLFLYDGARAVFHERAISILNSRTYLGSPPRRVAAFPDGFDPLAWRGLAEGANFYAVYSLSVQKPFDPTAGVFLFQSQENAVIRSASQTRPFQDLLKFTQYPLWRTTPAPEAPNGVQVQLSDMRFGSPQHPELTAVATLDAQQRVVRSEFLFLGLTRR